MSVPAPREPRHGGGRWDAIIAALGSWPCILQLCLVLLVEAAACSAVAAVVTTLIRHML
jgi:hypothetical protein